MGKKSSWDVTDNGLLSVTMPEGAKAEFSLTDLFPGYSELNDVQKYIISYGAKQSMSDKTAKNKDEALTEDEKISAMKDKWQGFIDGKIKTRTSGISVKAQLKETEKKLDAMMDVLTEEQIEKLKEMGVKF